MCRSKRLWFRKALPDCCLRVGGGCPAFLQVWNPGAWVLPSRPVPLSCLSGPRTPVIREQRKKTQAAGSTGAQQEGGTGGTAGAMPRGRSFPPTYSSHSPHPGQADPAPHTQSLPGPAPRGRRRGSCPGKFSLPRLRRGRGSRAPGRPPHPVQDPPPPPRSAREGWGPLASVDPGM